jgi:hypothetical protein
MADPEQQKYAPKLIENFRVARIYESSTVILEDMGIKSLERRLQRVLVELIDKPTNFAQILNCLFLINMEEKYPDYKKHLGDRKDYILSNEKLAMLVCDLFGPKFPSKNAYVGGDHNDYNITHC